MSVSDTSAIPVGCRSRVPAKITSSIRDPRNDFADCSPRTHEMASAMLDLPQPFGPMIAATPSPGNFSSVRSQNDLNPNTWSFFSLSTFHSLMLRHAENAHEETQADSRWLGRSLHELAGGRRAGALLTTWMPPPVATHIHLSGLRQRGTNCSYCTGKIGPGSRNKTLYIGAPCSIPRPVEDAMRLPPGLRVGKGRTRKIARAKKG